MYINQLQEKLLENKSTFFRQITGGDNQLILQQINRCNSLIKRYKASFDNREIDLFSSPGRTEIGGNHTDHNHGRVLAGAVTLDNLAVAGANGTSLIRIESEGYAGIEVDIRQLDPDPAEKFTSASLVRGICSRMKQLGYSIGGFDACIDGGVPKGSGLSSSAAFEVLIGVILSHLFNEGKLDPIQNALIGQYAENHYFGKPCGLMDQTACAMGGLITIDFKDPENPIVKKVPFDFQSTGFSLVITDTGGSHADLNDEYAALPAEMKAVAAELGGTVLREVSLDQIIENILVLREKTGDRAILRALHFQGDNQRVVEQVKALETGDFNTFLKLVIESGFSSFMYNQNIYPVHLVREQGLSLALALSELVLKGKGAWRVHGGGFAGTIQAFVPADLLDKYISKLELAFGPGSCHKLMIRPVGAVRIDFD